LVYNQFSYTELGNAQPQLLIDICLFILTFLFSSLVQQFGKTKGSTDQLQAALKGFKF